MSDGLFDLAMNAEEHVFFRFPFGALEKKLWPENEMVRKISE